RDFDAVGAHFLDDGEYTDVPSPDDDVARGPAEIAARLRLGLEPLERLHHDIRLMVAEDDSVVTEHVEHWHWSSGEHVGLPSVSSRWRTRLSRSLAGSGSSSPTPTSSEFRFPRLLAAAATG